MADKSRSIIVAITGASGAIYGIRLTQVLSQCQGIKVRLIISDNAKTSISYETDWLLDDIRALSDRFYDLDDIGADIASGSAGADGMIIAPCSMKTLSAVANSYGDNLITRAADVILKERKKLLLLVRETPLHLGHLKNMERATEMGAVILPPVPAFYYRPETIDQLIDHTIGKTLDFFDIPHNLFPRWTGIRKNLKSTD